jgi:hypothetical protein
MTLQLNLTNVRGTEILQTLPERKTDSNCWSPFDGDALRTPIFGPGLYTVFQKWICSAASKMAIVNDRRKKLPQFARDSLLEEDGLELAVSPRTE